MSQRAASERSSGLFDPAPREQVVAELVERSRKRLDRMADPALEAVLEDALWHERKRLHRKDHSEEPELDHLDELARALVRGSRPERIGAGLRLVRDWSDEIHGRFDPRVYDVATRALPKGLAALLSGRPRIGLRSDRSLPEWDLRPESRILVKGDLPWLHELAQEATLILAPTHVSNLDSPLVGLALFLAGLPPFVYGAGLNLFSNKIIGWWMHRLGAYTVDRTKKATLYKDVLKDYSVRALTTGHHSLFFPGGTRARSGEVEPRLKKGLLGTGIVAWQEMLQARKDRGPGRRTAEVYVVPLSLSYTLVLEAATLIEDHLAEAGKQRYIISDDEFAQPRRMFAFARRVLDLDAAVIAHFGAPLDVFGNPVARDPAERAAQAERRARYVCDRNGDVTWDEQRDHAYTVRLSEALVDGFARYTHPLPTHVAAAAAWRCLCEQVGSTDPFRVVRSPIEKRRIPGERYLRELRQVVDTLRAGAREGRWVADELDGPVEALLEVALDRFARYHRSHALIRRGTELVVEDPKLCLYYRNRTTIMDRPPRRRPLGEGVS
ncbi:MAG: 1-acyl-sn-glycerol-3-phosphate acyltransferase [Myxococcota bacterium]